MNQFSLKPQVLLLATAFAAASVVNAQTTDSMPASTAAAPAADSSTSYAPCSGMQGTALSECLKGSAANPTTPDHQAAASTSSPTGIMDSKAAPNDSTSMDRTILAAGGSAAHSTKATKSKSASTNQTHVASATPRTSSRTQSKNAATANPADTAYRAELRNCAQMQGGDRDSCLDRAIEHHATS